LAYAPLLKLARGPAGRVGSPTARGEDSLRFIAGYWVFAEDLRRDPRGENPTRNIAIDDGVRPDPGMAPDFDAAEHLGSRSNVNSVADSRRPARETLPIDADRHSLTDVAALAHHHIAADHYSTEMTYV